jgi:integrase
MSIEKKIFSVRNYTNVSCLNKRWYLRIKVIDYNKGGFVWKKLYGDINKYTTSQDRQTECKRMISEIESNGNYITNQGCRIINQSKEELFFSSAIYQLYNALDYKKIHLRQCSYSKYKGQIKVFENYLIKQKLENLPLGQLSYEIIQDFLQKIILEKNQSSSSYNSYLTLLKGFYTSFVKQKKIAHNPFEGIKKLSRNSAVAVCYDTEKIKKISDYCNVNDNQLWLFIQFIYYCFIRPKELRLLQIKNIDFTKMQINIPGNISKNKKNQSVAIPYPLFEQIKCWQICNEEYYLFSKVQRPGTAQIGINEMKIKFRKCCEEIKIPSMFKMYHFKHTGAVNFINAGGGVKDLQMQLRHYSLDITNVYVDSMQASDSIFLKNNFPAIV